MDRDAVADAERVPHGGADDPDVLDLSANTNPAVPEGTREVYEAAFDDARRYPEDTYADFRDAAAAFVDCDPDEVVATPGGLAALRLAFSVALDPGDRAVVPAPSFGEYAREIELQGATPEFVAHDAVTETDPADYAVAVVATPNNPTGDAVAPAALRAYAERCRAAGTLLVVDEAFLGFTEYESLAGTPGTVVARSLTKLFGLPGLRAGYAVATGDVGDRLRTARRAWNLGTPAAAVGAHCLRDDAFVAATRERVVRERERLVAGLAPAYEVHPSDAPYLLLDCGDRDVDALLGRAREEGVILRDARTFRGLDAHVRIAVKDADATDRTLAVVLDD